MASDFLNRTSELRALEQAWESREPALGLVWGRRRAGKTRLLGTFVEGKRSVFYGATQQASPTELNGLANAARDALQPTSPDLLALGDFTDWSSALKYLADHAKHERLIVVLDEFPYLVEAEPALPSIIQRFWDHAGRKTRLMLLLCGSAHGMMVELQQERAPLFGRFDLRLHVRPFDHRHAALFAPGATSEDRAVMYGVLGGMPTYLQRWRDDLGYRANLRRLFADPTSPLIDEGELVLSSELPEAAGYFRILHAIAIGNHTYGAIKTFACIEIQHQLARLMKIGLVERVVPVTEDPSRTKRAEYRIADNFLAFWFRFVYRSRSDIARGLGGQVVDHAILPNLAQYIGGPWEEMCREHLRLLAAAGTLPVPVSTIGRWWNRDSSVEIDIVGLEGSTVVLAGSVKWSKSAGVRELRRLKRSAESLPNRSETLALALFARDEVRPLAEPVLSFTAQDVTRSEPA